MLQFMVLMRFCRMYWRMDLNILTIAYASRTLSQSENNYAQVEKEALALVYSVKKFHQHLYGRRFTLITDHKPLLKIIGPKTGIPPIAAARMQRWALTLSAYSKLQKSCNWHTLCTKPLIRLEVNGYEYHYKCESEL